LTIIEKLSSLPKKLSVGGKVKITRLDDTFNYLRERPKKRLVVAYGQDVHTIEGVHQAVTKGLIEATIVGDEKVIMKVCAEKGFDRNLFEIIHESNESKAGTLAVDQILDGKGDFLMKGLISTDKYMRAILNKERGLLPPGGVLSHVTVIECQNYHKLLIVGDVAVIPEPDLKQKIAITNYLVKTAQSVGIAQPKVAIISATEKVNPKMNSCVDAAILSKMAQRGQIKDAIIDGPFAMDVAIDKESADIKGIESVVAGDADCILFPEIVSGNVFYKTMTKMAKAQLGAFVVGAKVPAILPSRGDDAKSKLYSIALAALSA